MWAIDLLGWFGIIIIGGLIIAGIVYLVASLGITIAIILLRGIVRVLIYCLPLIPVITGFIVLAMKDYDDWAGILLIGGVVGFIVFAVLLPVFNIGAIVE